MGIPLPDLDLTDVSPGAGMKKGCDLIPERSPEMS